MQSAVQAAIRSQRYYKRRRAGSAGQLNAWTVTRRCTAAMTGCRWEREEQVRKPTPLLAAAAEVAQHSLRRMIVAAGREVPGAFDTAGPPAILHEPIHGKAGILTLAPARQGVHQVIAWPAGGACADAATRRNRFSVFERSDVRAMSTRPDRASGSRCCRPRSRTSNTVCADCFYTFEREYNRRRQGERTTSSQETAQVARRARPSSAQ